MDQSDISRLVLGIALHKVIATFVDDSPTWEIFPIDRIQFDTGASDVPGFVTVWAGQEKIHLVFGNGCHEVEANIWGNGALKTLRRIKEEYLPAHYPKIKIIEKTIVTKN